VIGAFSMKDPEEKLDPLTPYILVDDVTTTGATLRECESVLREHGARDIRAIVIAANV
jgi:predicted amidophosphoribosyltransferase